MNTSKILISSIVGILILIGGFIYLFRENKVTPQDTIATDATQKPSILDVVLNRDNISTTTVQIPENTIPSTIDTETTSYQKIKVGIDKWVIEKDPQLLIEPINLSNGTSNEFLLEPWKPVISENSTELMVSITSSTFTPKQIASFYTIFDWYVKMSGEYEKLSPEKKLEISKYYLLLRSYASKV